MLDLIPSSGSQTRTDDLWVMSPTSCHCSIPQFASAKVMLFADMSSHLGEKTVLFNIFLLKTIGVWAQKERCGTPNSMAIPQRMMN